MASLEKVTVDKAYFDALLRRADFHTSTPSFSRADPEDITISRTEYDSLLRAFREYELLKIALFQGGLTVETLNLLIASPTDHEQRKDSGIGIVDVETQQPQNETLFDQSSSWRHNGYHAGLTSQFDSRDRPRYLCNARNSFAEGSILPSHGLRIPSLPRHTSYGTTNDDATFNDGDESLQENRTTTGFPASTDSHEPRTLYFSGFSQHTTYRDLISVIKGGKLLNINMRSERSATVTFYEGASEFLAWAKRNDVYINSKRIEVKWADRQYTLNKHIINKISNGATRNIIIHTALEKGLNEARIREDMEHIHNLIIVDVTFRQGDAYVSTNSVHNALFARPCMMSRAEYKGCKVEFYRDECDVPLPVRTFESRGPGIAPMPKSRKPIVGNRFGMLKIECAEDWQRRGEPDA